MANNIDRPDGLLTDDMYDWNFDGIATGHLLAAGHKKPIGFNSALCQRFAEIIMFTISECVLRLVSCRMLQITEASSECVCGFCLVCRSDD